MEFFENVGKVALGTQTRYLGEALAREAVEIYRLYGIEMNPKWFPVFYLLSREPNLTFTAIATAIGQSHVSVVKHVAEMKRVELIVETVSPDDRRRSRVALTRRGRAVAKKLEQQYIDVQSALEQLEKETNHDLWAALTAWTANLQRKSLFDRVRTIKAEREGGDLRIVPFAPKYRAAFRALNEEWIKRHFKMEAPDHAALDAPESYIIGRGGAIFVALLGQKPVGVCALLKRKDSRYPYELAKMAVAEAARGRRIGYHLGKAVIAEAERRQANVLFLESNTILAPAIALYKRLGFEVVTGPQTPYARANIQMALKLPTAPRLPREPSVGSKSRARSS